MKKLEEMKIRPAANGGHQVIHEFARQMGKREGSMSGGMYMERPPSEEHVFGPKDGSQMMAHVAKHLGLKQEAKEEAAEAKD